MDIQQNMEENSQIPDQFLCPISTQLMKDPVIAADGITYQRKSIQEWMKRSNDSPFTRNKFPHQTLITNYALKNTISKYFQKLPTIKKEKQIRTNLQYAIKLKLDEIKQYFDKNNNRTPLGINQEQFQALKIRNKQLQKQLLIERRTLSQTQNILNQYQDKCMALQINMKQITYQLKISRQKQCKCYNLNEQQYKPNNSLINEKYNNKLADQILQQLQSNPKKLKIQRKKLSSIDIEHLMETINRNQINTISIEYCDIGDEGLKALTNKKFEYPQLDHLSLTDNNFTDIGIKYLCDASEKFPKINILRLDQNKIGKQGVKQLGKSKMLNRLSCLYMKNTFNAEQNINLLFPSKQYPKMKDLSLISNSLGNKAMKYLSEIEFSKLQSFFIYDNMISFQGIKQFVKNSKEFTFLSWLYLSNRLYKYLFLDDNNLCAQSIQVLTSRTNLFNSVQRLTLYFNKKIGDKGVQYLIQRLDAFPSLNQLFISSCNITDKGIETILKSDNKILKQLKTLIILTNPIEDKQKTKQKLKNKFPNLVRIE